MRLVFDIATSRALTLAIDDDLLGLGRIGHHLQRIADLGQRFETEHFGGHRRQHFANRLAAIVEHRAHASEHRSADEIIADVQRAVAHQHRRHRTAAAIELRFEHRAHGGPRRIGLQILHIRDQQNHFEQQIQIRLGPAPKPEPSRYRRPSLRPATRDPPAAA